MNTYIIDVDSSSRNSTLWPYANNYSVTMSRPLYDVKNMKLVSAAIDLDHCVISSGSTITVAIGGGATNTYTVPVGNYTLAGLANILDSLIPSIAVTFSEHHTLIFTGGSSTYTITPIGSLKKAFGIPDDSFTFTGSDPFHLSTVVQSPKSIVFRIFKNDTDLLAQPVYTDDGFSYSARMMSINSTKYSYSDDPIILFFNKGSIPSLLSLKIEIYDGETNELYNFGNRDHLLKFEVTCSLDKFNTMNEKLPVPYFKELPEPINYTPQYNNDIYIRIVVGILLTLGLYIILSKPQKPSESVVASP